MLQSARVASTATRAHTLAELACQGVALQYRALTDGLDEGATTRYARTAGNALGIDLTREIREAHEAADAGANECVAMRTALAAIVDAIDAELLALCGSRLGE